MSQQFHFNVEFFIYIRTRCWDKSIKLWSVLTFVRTMSLQMEPLINNDVEVFILKIFFLINNFYK